MAVFLKLVYFARHHHLYFGQHVDIVIPKGTANCSSQVTLEALEFILKKESNCFISQTYESTRFTKTKQVEETWLENKTNILFSSSNTQFYKSRIFCLFTFRVFFPDRIFKFISKYTQKCQYNSLN